MPACVLEIIHCSRMIGGEPRNVYCHGHTYGYMYAAIAWLYLWLYAYGYMYTWFPLMAVYGRFGCFIG